MNFIQKILLFLGLSLTLFAGDIIVYDNEYNVLELQKKVKKLVVGNKEMINVSLLHSSTSATTLLKIFGKKTGNTSILLLYKDGSVENYHVYVNKNLRFIQKMINVIEPNISLSKVGDGSTVMQGSFENPHDKKRIYALLESAGIDLKNLMDLTETKTVNKMVRTKLYLVEINNQRAKDLGGVTGLGFFNEYLDGVINPTATNGATFSGWLLDNAGAFSATKGNSVSATLNFLETQGIGTILDDTVLMTTEDKNASFRVGGEVYIPVGLTQNIGFAPTIQVEEREYGLDLILKSEFMEKDGFVHVDVTIKDSEFDPDKEHDVQLGPDIVVPSFVSKNIQTNVVVQSGQVIVLGGRLHSEDVDLEEKVPFLGDIPLLGELFKHTVADVKNNDLLFFLVPEIVDANKQVDETDFYKEFKQGSEVFHKNVMDMNKTKKEPALVVLNDTNIQKEQTIQTSSEGSDELLIEVEEPHSEVVIQEESEVVLEEPQEALEETQEVETKNVKEPTIQKYAVMSEKIFLRKAPADGQRVNVWSAGHSFTSSEERVVNGSVWLKVQEDCLGECENVTDEMWIAKKYVRLQ